MSRTTRIIIPLSSGRTIEFYTAGCGYRVICKGYVDPREIAEVKATALQRLADESFSQIKDGLQIYSPHFEPGRPAGVRYHTRLTPEPRTEVCRA